jgi:hypothetical protein
MWWKVRAIAAIRTILYNLTLFSLAVTNNTRYLFSKQPKNAG